MRRTLARLRALFSKDGLDRDFAQELDSHFEELVRDGERRGLPESEARRQARLALGQTAALAEIHRETRGVAWLDTLTRDIRYGIRALRRSWGLSAAAIASIALGVGANTGIFSLVDQALFRALPVRQPEQLVWLNPVGPSFGNPQGSFFVSHPMFRDLARSNDVFSGMFARSLLQAHTGYQGQTERVWAELVTGGYYETLGVRPHLGRLISPDDDRAPGAHPVCVLTFGYWQSRFDSDPQIIGKTIHINGHAFTIIGVSAARFEGLDIHLSPQIRVPSMMNAVMRPGPDELDDRRRTQWNTYGRLKPGLEIQQARERLQPLYRGILEIESTLPAFAKAPRDRVERFLQGKLELQPGWQPGMGDRAQVRSISLVLAAIAAVVLLIACANIANLLLARGVARHREIAVRLALGASRGRLVAQLLIESLLLAFAGGIAGLPIAYAVMLAALQFSPPDAMHAIQPALDGRVLLFDFAVSLLTGLTFGLLPALKSTRTHLSPALKQQAAAVAGGQSQWLRKGLVTAQIALSLALLVTAALFAASLRNLRNLDIGFPAGNLVTFSVEPKLNGYSAERTWQFRAQLQERLAALAGVEAVSFSRSQILGGDYLIDTAHAEGEQVLSESARWTFTDLVDSSYFRTIGLKIASGRAFEPRDQTGVPTTVLVNEAFARRFFPGVDAVGKRIGFGPASVTPLEIIGVVRKATFAWIRSDYEPLVYRPMPVTASHSPLAFYVRVQGNPEQLMRAVRQAVRELDPTLPVYQMRTMRKLVDERLSLERVCAVFSSWFGLIATLLGTVGLYGVMTYVVAGRTREIGVRMALGAARGRVLAEVMREVLVLVAAGTVAGLVLAYSLAGPLRRMIFGLAPDDPATLGATALLLATVAACAGLLPALRASRIDPVRALREE